LGSKLTLNHLFLVDEEEEIRVFIDGSQKKREKKNYWVINNQKSLMLYFVISVISVK